MTAWIARGLWGSLLLWDPGAPLRLGAAPETRQVRVAVRILGARHLAEALVLARSGSARPRRVIMSLDGAHAASMLVLAALRPDLRRDALLSAASAGGLIALTATAGR